MLLRRVTQHVKEQNWFAVGVDFVIVVIGVYIGIQVSNWNDEKVARNDYLKALGRYSAEVDANIKNLQALDERANERIATSNKAFDTLLSCQDSPESREIVERGIERISGSYGIDIQLTSLRELTESPNLLAQQSVEERKILNDTRVKIEFLLSESDYLEDLPLKSRIELNPIIGIGPRKIESNSYSDDITYAPSIHLLKLVVPIDVACKDNTLIKDFYTWENWQSFIPDISHTLQLTLIESKKALEL